MTAESRLRWKAIKASNGLAAWEAPLPWGRGRCYTIYRKGRRYSLVYWSGASAIASTHGPYKTLEGAKRAAKRLETWSAG